MPVPLETSPREEGRIREPGRGEEGEFWVIRRRVGYKEGRGYAGGGWKEGVAGRVVAKGGFLLREGVYWAFLKSAMAVVGFFPATTGFL